MKRLSLLFFLTISCVIIYAQSTEITIGYILNNFFDLEEDEAYNSSTYYDRGGFGLGVAIENVMIDSIKVRYTLSYSKYAGKIRNYNGGKGSGTTIMANVHKSIVSLGFFPVNLKILKRIDLNLGFEGSILLHEHFSGSISKRQLIYDDEMEDLDNDIRFNARFHAGACGRLAYDISLSEHVFLSPQYSFYLGLTKEFEDYSTETKSKRHFFGLGIQWAWK